MGMVARVLLQNRYNGDKKDFTKIVVFIFRIFSKIPVQIINRFGLCPLKDVYS